MEKELQSVGKILLVSLIAFIDNLKHERNFTCFSTRHQMAFFQKITASVQTE